jgi:hypothetical protein
MSQRETAERERESWAEDALSDLRGGIVQCGLGVPDLSCAGIVGGSDLMDHHCILIIVSLS